MRHLLLLSFASVLFAAPAAALNADYWRGGWRTPLGDAPSISKLLDDSTQPVDKDVFMRELAYYQIKIDSK